MSDLRAVIYLQAGEQMARWQRICGTHVEARGYELVSIVIDGADGAKWPDVLTLLRGDRADVIVVARRDQLPKDRLPRIEVATEEPTLQLRQRQPVRRPRVIGR
jgi:hypothetical protein